MTQSEWAAWPVKEPPRGFAERVVQTALLGQAKRRRRSRLLRGVTIGSIVLAAAAATVLYERTPSQGDVTALGRREVRLGSHARATAVLERGAHVSWIGDAVIQSSGDVFYRVERGGGFSVHTPAGDVSVKGTCFRVALGEGSAAGVVTVFEGKVAVSRGRQALDLGAGDGATLDEAGVQIGNAVVGGGARQANPDSAQAAFAALASLQAEKADLDQRLTHAQQELANRTAPSATAMTTTKIWDQLPDDWAELAKAGIVKYVLPCDHPKDWTPSADILNALALSPDDAAVLKKAHEQSSERLWNAVKSLCIEVSGSEDAAEKLGSYTCSHLVMARATDRDRHALEEKMRAVAEMRAGKRPMPQPTEAGDPIIRLLLAMTEEMGNFEHDLGESIGREEAHRIAHAEGMCVTRDAWGPQL